MKRYIVLLLLATQILPAYSSNSLQYPDDCCIYDTKNNYAVMLSSLYNNFVAYYGLADNRELIHFDIQGREQIWSYRYNIGLQIYVYNFYNSMFKIQVSSPQFRTSSARSLMAQKSMNITIMFLSLTERKLLLRKRISIRSCHL